MSPLRLGPIAGRPAATSRRSGLGRARALWLGLSAALVGALFLLSPFLLKKGVAKEQVRLPAAALQAIREIFPKVAILEATMQDDDGVTLFAVEMKVGEKYVEVLASPDGVVVEVSIEISSADVPEAALAAIRKVAEGAQITEFDIVGDHAEVRDGKFARLLAARTAYWAEFEKGGMGGEVTVAPDGTIVETATEIEAKDVPEAALAAIRKAAEGARITEIDREETHAEPKGGTFAKLDNVRTAYWAEFVKGELTGEITVAPDGTVVETSDELEAKDVPEAALAAIRKAAEGAQITELGRDETRAELEGGKFVELPKAEVFYWAEFQKDELAAEVSVAPGGAVEEVLRWKCITEPAGEDSKKSAGPRPVKGKRP